MKVNLDKLVKGKRYLVDVVIDEETERIEGTFVWSAVWEAENELLYFFDIGEARNFEVRPFEIVNFKEIKQNIFLPLTCDNAHDTI